jgi:hypothetical protein
MRLNLAARAGRWSAAHWKTATFGWLAFVALAVAIGSVVGTRQLGDNEGLPRDSGRMQKILDESFQTPAAEIVLVQSDTLTAESPAFRAAADDVARTAVHGGWANASCVRLGDHPASSVVSSPVSASGATSRTGLQHLLAAVHEDIPVLLPRYVDPHRWNERSES